MSKRQYILKPGNHQFTPRGPAEHNNENTSDEECAMYLEKHPHIKNQFEKLPKKPKIKPSENPIDEDLPTAD